MTEREQKPGLRPVANPQTRDDRPAAKVIPFQSAVRRKPPRPQPPPTPPKGPPTAA